MQRRLLRLIPVHIRPLFLDPPVLWGEDECHFILLTIGCIEDVQPRDYFEWVWVKDIAYHVWEIRRLQEFKCQLIDIGAVARIVLARTPTLKIDSFEQSEWDKYANPICASVLTSDKSSVEIYQTLDRLIASAELRRDRIIRELQRHREQKAWQLDNASAKVIKGHFSTKNRSAA